MSAVTPDIDLRDAYATLGVTPDTPFPEVKLVYRRLVRELHPDVNPDDPQARERFDAVQTAFEQLRAQQVPTRRPAPVESIDELQRMSSRESEGESAAPTITRTAPEPRQVFITGGLNSVGSGNLLNRLVPSPDKVVGAPDTQLRQPVERPANERTRNLEPRLEAPVSHSVEDAPLLQLLAVPGRNRLLLQSRAQMFYLLLDLKLGEQVRVARQPINLSLVLDHSSSMQRNDKLQRLKEAVSRIIDSMDPTDYLSIITFGDRASVLLPSTELGNKRAAKEALDGIRCRGGTEISNGMRVGLHELQRNPNPYISQMILLTDGQTYGDEAICLDLASQAGERQVQITALGLEDDWNSTLLDDVAARTGGTADYVQSAEQLSAVFEEQLRTLQLTALRNMQLSITPAPNCGLIRATWVAPAIQPLTLPTTMQSGQPCTLDLGRMSVDREYRMLLELVVASREAGSTNLADLTISYDVPGLQREGETTHSTVTAHFVREWDKEPPVDLRVHDALRKITAHRLQEQALQAIQEGQTLKGTANLRTAAKHLEEAGCADLAGLARAEADRVERKGQVQAGAMKRIIYGTRKLG